MSRSEARIHRHPNGTLALIVLGAFLLGSVGCVEVARKEGREPLDYDAVAAGPRIPPSEGAIYRPGSGGGSFLFYDQKARKVGDLVTVIIAESTSAEGDADTELKGSRTIAGTLSSDIGFQAMISQPIRAFLGFVGFKNPGRDVAEGTEMNVIDSQFTNDFKGEGATGRSGKFQGVVTCRVINILPNGVFHIRGRRWITINHEAQYVSLEGLVRREDMGINNMVFSNSVAELRLSYDGVGVMDDKQRPGWLARALDWIYPL